MNSTHKLIVLALLLTGCVAASAQTKEGPWLLRTRVVNLQSVNSDSTGLGLGVNNKTFLEVDISYSLSKTLAIELVLAAPQEHTLTSNGEVIGSVTQLPPTLLLQYRLGGKAVKPYVGAGLNYTAFTSVAAPPGVTISRSSTGLAFQAGLDIPLSKSVSANLDVKKVFISTKVSSAGSAMGEFKIDPWLVGMGVGYRF